MTLQTDSRLLESSIANALDLPPADHRFDAHARCLCRFDDGVVFAYAERGHEFIRASDRELWAVERDDALVSVRSGAVLARRRGRVYFEAESDAPTFYERAI